MKGRNGTQQKKNQLQAALHAWLKLAVVLLCIHELQVPPRVDTTLMSSTFLMQELSKSQPLFGTSLVSL